jgi:hypothetical protein
MPDNSDHREYLREKATLMRRLSREHAAADNPLMAAKFAEIAAVLEARATTLERSPPRREDPLNNRDENDGAEHRPRSSVPSDKKRMAGQGDRLEYVP